MKNIYLLSLIVLVISISSCEKETIVTNTVTETVTVTDTIYENSFSSSIEFYNKDLVDDNYVLVVENAQDYSYIINKLGDTIKRLDFNNKLGNDFQLYSNTSFVGIFKINDTEHTYPGGVGGKIQIIDFNNTILWDYELHNETESLHHDIEILPNGNILALVWTKSTLEESNSLGYLGNTPIVYEKIIEIDKSTKNIIWEWNVNDHTIQDQDATLDNYGAIETNQNKININYSFLNETPSQYDGDVFHANGITYDPLTGYIYLSVNFFSEVWVINHNITNDETPTEAGDLIYRFGNPLAYGNDADERLFFNNHHPTLINADNNKTFTIFNNGNNINLSSIYEFQIPNSFDQIDNNNLDVIFEYSNDSLYFKNISGVSKLDNGNYLISEGGYGIWEVTANQELAWKYKVSNKLWRSYSFSSDLLD